MKNAFGMDDSGNDRNMVLSQADQDVVTKASDKPVDKAKGNKRNHNLWNSIKRLSHKPIVKAIRGSALYSLLKALILVFLLLLLLFSIHPKEAFIRAELQKKDDDRIWIQAEELEVQGSSLYAYFSTQDIFSIDLYGISLNGSGCSKGDTLVVSPDNSNVPVLVSFWGHTKSIKLYDATIDVDDQREFSSQSTYLNFMGEITMRIEYGKAEYVTKDGERETIAVDYMNGITLTDLITQSIKNTGIRERLNNNNIGDRPCELKLSSFVASSKKESNMDVYIPYYDSISSNSVIACRLVASGDLYFSYKPAPEEYVIRGQELQFAASKSGLSLSYDTSDTLTSENPVFLSGYVREAQLSNMNLFPDFWVWYYSNLYLVPLTLISTVLAATSLFKASKKESDEEKQPKDSSDK